MAHESQTETEMKTYGSNVGVEFDWGFSYMFVLGFIYEYKSFSIAIGPLYLEWTW